MNVEKWSISKIESMSRPLNYPVSVGGYFNIFFVLDGVSYNRRVSNIFYENFAHIMDIEKGIGSLDLVLEETTVKIINSDLLKTFGEYFL